VATLRLGSQGRHWLVMIAVTCAAIACRSGNAALALPLRRIGVVTLPGRSTRFDYVSLDPARHLLVIAHLGDSEVVAIDAQTRHVAWRAPGIASAHGVTVAASAGRVFATATDTDELVALDEASGHELFRSPTGRFPDGVAFDPTTATVWVSNKDGGSESVFDASDGRQLVTVPVGGDVGNVQFDESSRRMVVAVGQSNELVLFTSGATTVDAHRPLPGCRGAHGVAVGAGRAFVACEDNARVLSVDLESGRIAGTGPTGEMPDVVALDATRQLLYVAAESGVVAAFDVGRDGLKALGKAKLADGAHTIASDPSTGFIYLPLPSLSGGPGVEILSPRP